MKFYIEFLHTLGLAWILNGIQPWFRIILGASLINAIVIYSREHFSSVVLGSSSLYMEQPGRLEVQVQKIMPHPFYDDVNLDNDIALIKLSSSVPFSDAIQPVCLNWDRNEISVFGTCYAAGWGLTSPQGGNN